MEGSENGKIPNLSGQVTLWSIRPVFNGQYSSVYHGSLGDQLVAVKVLKEINGAEVHTMRRKLHRELTAWGGLRHPNVLPLYGFAEDHELFQPFGALISPWRARGNAYEFLKAKGESMSLYQRINLWKGVVTGVDYLHTLRPALVHGDLKPANVLIDTNGIPQICDFGLVSILLDEGTSGMTTTSPHTGTDRYLAYELVLDGEQANPTTASDVFALGSIGLEFAFLQQPYASRKNNMWGRICADIRAGVPPAKRPESYEWLNWPIWDLLDRCWERNIHERINTRNLLAEVEKLQALLTPDTPQGSGHDENRPNAQLSMRPDSTPDPTPTSSAQSPNQSGPSASPSSTNTYNSASGSCTTPVTATSFNSHPNAGMSTHSPLHASTVGTPTGTPLSSGASAVVVTPTTVYQGGNQNTGENNTTEMATKVFQGYSPPYAEYTGSQEAVPQPLQIQATPTMSQYSYVDIYFNQVIGVQYRLANLQTLPRHMSDLSERSPAVRTSISLLSVLYLEAQQLAESGVGGTLPRDTNTTNTQDYGDPYSNLQVPGYRSINSSTPLPSDSSNLRAQYDLLYARVKQLLAAKRGEYDQGDAMACLHVISAFLFSGGRGDWDQFLQIAAQWVSCCVGDYSGNVAEALRNMDSMGRFIFRTTMWMDVFGSISLCRAPRFIQIYRTLFAPRALDAMTEPPIETNMDRVMGCPNGVFLAFAEIADLEARKEEMKRQSKDGPPGNLVPRLIDFVADPHSRWQQAMVSLNDESRSIESLIPEAALPMDRFVEVHSRPPLNTFNGTGTQAAANSQVQNHKSNNPDPNLLGGSSSNTPGDLCSLENDTQPDRTSGPSATLVSEPELGGFIDPDEDKRGKIAEVFRNAARLYLHSVISGCDPLVPTIRRDVQATIRALEILGASPLDRSLILPLVLAGCLAATRDQVAFCIGRLSLVGKDAESFGNCFAAGQLIESVWRKRTKSRSDGHNAVSWRAVMMEMNQDPLLLV